MIIVAMDITGYRRSTRIYLASLIVFVICSTLVNRSKATTTSMSVTIAAGIALFIVGVLVVVQRRLAVTLEHTQRLRPDAAIVPGYTSAHMRETARIAGGSTRGWLSQGGNPIAVAALPDRIEVWSGREDEPRFTFDRLTFAAIGVHPGGYGSRLVSCVSVTDSDGLGLLFVPAYRPLRAMGGSDAQSLQRAVRTLTDR